MASIKRQQKRYAKQQMERVLAGGDLVSDIEKRDLEKSAKVAEAAVGGVESLLNRDAMARATGQGVLIGSSGAAAGDIAEAGVTGQVQTAAQQQQMASALRDKRLGAILGFGTTVRQQNRADRQQAINATIGPETGALQLTAELGQQLGLAGMGM
jgi:hypothetical protein